MPLIPLTLIKELKDNNLLSWPVERPLNKAERDLAERALEALRGAERLPITIFQIKGSYTIDIEENRASFKGELYWLTSGVPEVLPETKDLDLGLNDHELMLLEEESVCP